MKAVVIGAGRMGLRHVEVIRRLKLDLVGVADPRESSLEAARAGGIAPELLHKDGAKMLAELKPELVVVATTTPGHAPLTCTAAEVGARFVLCEKPMASSLADCDRMIEICQRHGTRLSINHSLRFLEQNLRLKSILDGELGGWSSMTIVGGNIGLAMNGSHYFDLFRWLSGEAPESVVAWLSDGIVANPRGPEFEDRAGAVRVTTKSGKRLYLEAGVEQGHGLRSIYAGAHGVVVTDELEGLLDVAIRKPEHRALPSTRYGMPADQQTIRFAPVDATVLAEAALQALLDGRGYPTGEDGRAAVQTLVSAFVSHERGNALLHASSDLPRDRRFAYA